MTTEQATIQEEVATEDVVKDDEATDNGVKDEVVQEDVGKEESVEEQAERKQVPCRYCDGDVIHPNSPLMPVDGLTGEEFVKSARDFVHEEGTAHFEVVGRKGRYV